MQLLFRLCREVNTPRIIDSGESAMTCFECNSNRTLPVSGVRTPHVAYSEDFQLRDILLRGVIVTIVAVS